MINLFRRQRTLFKIKGRFSADRQSQVVAVGEPNGRSNRDRYPAMGVRIGSRYLAQPTGAMR
jgi:hypothetical protein